MMIDLSKQAVIAIGPKNLKEFGVSEDMDRYASTYHFDLSDYTLAKSRKFLTVLESAESFKGMKARINDVKTWIAILVDGANSKRVPNIKAFAPMAKQYLKTAPNHWLYEPDPMLDGQCNAYVVDCITYHPPVKRDGYIIPAYVTIDFYYQELGKYRSAQDKFYQEDVQDFTVKRALAEKGYQVETPELRAAYDANKAKYEQIWDKVGLQFRAVGKATQYLGDDDRNRSSYWWSPRSQTVRLDRDAPANVVIDILTEGDKDEDQGNRKATKNPSSSFWGTEGCDFEGTEEDNDKDLEPGDEDDDQEERTQELNVPLHPSVIVFDLKRHMRMKVHVDQLTQYEYDERMAKKLILPDEVTGLVELLLSHKGRFQDIVGTKGQGAIILCAGPPGTGKTLTSEVYSEAMKRPLYSVQCSQLGTSPDDLEKELLKVFARSVRWNAILLLDEADVYVAMRGSDMEQNAIVGVFLRVLEYYAGVLFMTTNRFDLVDDAIASRCLARIDYQIPTPADQKRIWRTLADTSGIQMKDTEIDKVVKEFPNLSGRDVKNLLKLGGMMADAAGGGLTSGMVKYCKQFKPTKDISRAKVPDDA